MSDRFDGRAVLITGGASGIGMATAIAFAREGASVVVADILEEEGQKTLDAVHELGGNAVFIKTNVSHADEVQSLVNQTVSTFGRLDCVCNNAGIEGMMASTAECTEENWDRIITINLKGVWLCMKYEIPEILRSGGGSIVNISSVAGLVGFAGMPAYCASKGGIVQLTKTAALEYAEAGIRINAVCPGGIRTPMLDRIEATRPELRQGLVAMHPMKRLGTPEEVAQAVLWLCSDQASFVTGQAIAVDGGFVAQ